jgi:hypothetical protein
MWISTRYTKRNVAGSSSIGIVGVYENRDRVIMGCISLVLLYKLDALSSLKKHFQLRQ